MGIYRGTGGTGDSTTDTTVTTVTEKAAEAASSATSAANSATSAANSASSASASETNAATSETNAANSATASATSATASETAKTAAQAAQTAAETAQANAETAEANAVTAKNQAVSAKDNAVTAQTAAETAETNAETAYANTLAIYGSTTDVQNAVNSASASATTATTKAAEAASSATDASNYSSSAGTSATQAASSASQAATSAASANSYATDAQTAQTAAETAQAAAEAAEYNINGLYLGSLADDPTLDGNGVAVTTGDLYFNTTAQEVRVYTDGDVWEPVVDLAGDITVNSLTSNNNVVVKGNLEVQGTTITVDSATAQTIDLGDNDKIRLGDSDDLQIYHSGTHSYISDQGTGNLIIEGAHFLIQTPNAEKILQGLNNGAVSLYYDGATKLDTTSSGVDITGNITVSGTVDGRDIAADGTTLDAVASTYVDVSGDTLTGDLAFGDNVKAKFGASDDLQIYHGGAHSFIDDAGTGNLYIRGSQINLSKYTGETLASFVSDGAVTLYYDNASKLATTSSGVDITGTVVADGLTVDGNATITESQGAIGTNHLELISADNTARKWGLRFGSGGNGNLSFDRYFGAWYSALEIDRGTGDISFYEDTGTTAKLTWDASAEELQFKDNVKAEFGDGGDLVIYHDGSASWIDDAGTGNLNIRGGGGIFLRSPANETMIEAVGNGKVGLYYDASQKLATTSTGIDVTGTVTADGLTVQNNGNTSVIFGETSGGDSTTVEIGKGFNATSAIEWHRFSDIDFKIQVDDNESGSILYNYSDLTLPTFDVRRGSAETKVLRATVDGDVVLYDSTGTSQDFYWDASTSRLGLGVTSPSYQLQLGGSSDSTLAFFRSTTDTAQIVIRDDDTIGYFGARNNFIYISPTSGTGADGLVVRTDTGNVGIGTTSPDTVLHVENGATSYTWTPNGRTAAIIEGNNFSGTTLSIIGKSTGYSGIFFGDEAYEADGQINYDHTTGGMRFATRGSEKARIDSSGNLLVGTTDSTLYNNTSGEGVGLIGGDHIEVARSGGPPIFLNRMTSDGNIAVFNKDGTTVGSIGVDSTDNLFISGNSTHAGFMFGTANVVPYANGNATDDAMDLGWSGGRFKNLYLSGGVYLGGGGSANLLDDYEEGTFTPTFGGSTTDPSGITYDHQIGSYTKVGTLVQVTIKLGTDAITSIGSGNLRIRGLPFNPNYAVGAGRPTAYSFASNIEDYNIYVANGYFDLLKGSPFGYAQTSVLGTGTNANRLWVTFSYQTT